MFLEIKWIQFAIWNVIYSHNFSIKSKTMWKIYKKLYREGSYISTSEHHRKFAIPYLLKILYLYLS